MIITRTPFRISFFGGGTDYPVWFRKNGGAVLSTTIDKYCYISCRFLPPFFYHKNRFVWSKIELPNRVSEISHPAIRGAIKYLKIKEGLEIHHQGDLPARSGMGSSSSFVVGLLNGLYALRGRMISKKELAEEAIHLEQKVLKENVGCQDQIAAAFGGFNRIDFDADRSFRVTPITLKNERLGDLKKHLLLLYTSIERTASAIAAEQIKATPGKSGELTALREMVEEGCRILNSKGSLADFGKLLHESWLLKRSLTGKISNSVIDEIYDKALKSGALGGKILGAGGGGFILLFVTPERRKFVQKKLAHLLEAPFSFEKLGSQVIFYNHP